MMNVYSIQKLFKCLNPLLMFPYTWNIDRNHSVTLYVKNDVILQYVPNVVECRTLEVTVITPWIHKQQLKKKEILEIEKINNGITAR